MTKTFTILSLTLLIIGCSDSPRIKQATQKNETVPTSSQESLDSLRSPFHEAYYSDISLREFGQLVLDDSVQPMDNPKTFQLMDSILSPSKETRDYYYPIFQYIIGKADGALGEVVGIYTKKYVEQYSKEFFERYACFEETESCYDELKRMATFVGFEIQVQDNPEKSFTSLKEIIRNDNKVVKAFLKLISNKTSL